MLTPTQVWYGFWLGLACGLTGLTITAYGDVSPRWLRAVLIASGLFVISRYVTMLLFAISPDWQTWWPLRRCWLATSIGLTWPTVVAVDQLVRHPAMTPKKLLIRFSPFAIVYALVILASTWTPLHDPRLGWMPRLSPGWRLALSITQSAFVVGFLGLGSLLIRKLPAQPVRIALAALMASHLYLAIDGLLLAAGAWDFRPFLFSEMAALLAIWWALRTARTAG